MKAGLLGAIGGLGQAMQTAGKDIIARRERALDEARRMAEYERARADKQIDKEEDRDFQVGMEEARQERLDARHSASLATQASEGAANRGERAEDRSFRAAEGSKDRAARRELTVLSKSLEGENSRAATRLAKTLSAGDVHAVQYGAPDANGYAEVITILKDGSIRKTGQKVYRPKRDDEDEDEAL
jgi:hypothetical protein